MRQPEASDTAKEIYEFIVSNPYTINRGGGMGLDSVIGPDMAKLCEVAKYEGIDIYTYKDYCVEFVSLQSKQESKVRKKTEKSTNNKKV